MVRLTFLLAVLLLWTSSQAVAQAPPLEPGTRVRITGCGTGIGPREGAFVGVRADTLFLNQDTGIMECPLSAVNGLEVFAGRSSAWKSGASIGALVTGLPLAAAVVLGCSRNRSDPGCEGAGDVVGGAWTFLVIGAVPGALLGGLIGAIRGTERWEAVPLHPPLLSVRPSFSGQIGFGLTFRVPDW